MRPRSRLAPLILASFLFFAACSSEPSTSTSSPAGDTGGEDTGATSGSASATAEERLAAAPAATVSAGSARTTFTATLLDVGGDTGTLTFGGEGEIDFEAERASSRSDLTELLRSNGMEDVDGEMESVVDGTISYLRSPFFTSMVNAPTPWVRIDPAALESVTGMDMSQLSGLTSNDPNAQLAFLAGVVEGSVEELGDGEVRGTPTTRFRATVDLRKAAEDAGAVTDPAQFEQFVATLGGGELTVEVDLDEDDRVRMLSYEHRLPVESGGGHQQVELEYFDFGADVDISLPPDDQVTDLTELFQAGQ